MPPCIRHKSHVNIHTYIANSIIIRSVSWIHWSLKLHMIPVIDIYVMYFLGIGWRMTSYHARHMFERSPVLKGIFDGLLLIPLPSADCRAHFLECLTNVFFFLL